MNKNTKQNPQTINTYFAFSNREKQIPYIRRILLKESIQQLKATAKNDAIQAQ